MPLVLDMVMFADSDGMAKRVWEWGCNTDITILPHDVGTY